MYESYFGLTERPFSIAPDPQYLYMSARHKEAMAHLSYGLSQGGCFIVLTGEVGTGKTTLCRNLMTDLPDNVDLALILNANINETELLQTICDELKISFAEDHSQKQLLDLINQHLLSTFADSRHTVLIIDEAQLLSRDVLEQVRLLTNLETTKHKLLQIILIGQPELNDMLTRNDLRQLAQRVTARYHLGELKRSEIEEYVNYRLGVAGCKQPLFSNQALSKLHQLTDGIPRKINVLADHALLSAYAQKQRLVDSHNVKESAKEVFFTSKSTPMVSSSTKKWVLLGLALVLLNIAFWWYFLSANKDAPDLRLENDSSATTVTPVEGETRLALDPEQVNADAELQFELLETQPEKTSPAAVVEEVVQESVQEVVQDSDQEPVQEVAEQSIELLSEASVATINSQPVASGSVVLSQKYLEADEGDIELQPTAQVNPTQPTLSAQEIAQRALSEQTEFGRILETSADLTGRVTVFRALTRVWGVELPGQLFKPMCEEAQTRGLQCIFFTNWDQFLRFNRPSVLVLRHNNQLHRVIVEVIDDTAAEVQVGDSIYRISVEELQSRWQGNDAVLLWRPSDAGSKFLQQGNTEASLPLIRTYLNAAFEYSELPLLASQDRTDFDLDLAQKLVNLQRAFGLLVDGKIGNETYLLMNELLQPNTTPVLRSRVAQ